MKNVQQKTRLGIGWHEHWSVLQLKKNLASTNDLNYFFLLSRNERKLIIDYVCILYDSLDARPRLKLHSFVSATASLPSYHSK